MRLVRRDHMPSGIHNIECKAVILCYPTFKTSPCILYRFFSLYHRPADSKNILLRLNIGHLSIHVSRVKQNLQTSFFEVFEKLKRG